MKATITDSGQLLVEPECPLELYAMRCWHEDWAVGRGTVAIDITTAWAIRKDGPPLTIIRNVNATHGERGTQWPESQSTHRSFEAAVSALNNQQDPKPRP